MIHINGEDGTQAWVEPSEVIAVVPSKAGCDLLMRNGWTMELTGITADEAGGIIQKEKARQDGT